MQIEWSEAEVLKSGGVGMEAEVEGVESVEKENRWWKTVGYGARSRDQVRSGADGGGARRTVQSFRIVEERFHVGVVSNRGGERSWI
jgi:hypothetical protein